MKFTISAYHGVKCMFISCSSGEIEVHVIAPEDLPLAKILGPDLGTFVRDLHVTNGVVFHLGKTGTGFDAKILTLSDGATLDVDLVVQGVGVRPRIALAEKAGLSVNKGVTVDIHFRTSADAVYAAGDIALYPDALTGEPGRVPVRCGISLGDTLAALHGCIGVLTALYHRQAHGGRGQVIDVALNEAVFNVMESLLPEYSAFGAVRKAAGSALPGIAPSNAYACVDGWVLVAGNGDGIFTRLLST